MTVLLVVVCAVGAWMAMLVVGGTDRQETWERRHKRRYRGYHRARPARVGRHYRH